MKLTTIMDNLPGERKGLTAEHGLSFLVETNTAKILFDFGAGSNTWENASLLNIKPEGISFAVGSHGHYDHACGYSAFAEHGLDCPLYTGIGYFQEKYTRNGIKSAYLGTGFDEDWMRQKGLEHRVCGNRMELTPGCYLVGNICRSYEFETIPERFVLREGNQWIPDTFKDEICLVLEEKDGLVVILGCSHPGVLNMLSTVQQRFGKKIAAVFGGTHLMEADRRRVDKTLEIMKTMGIGLIGFNHCSGEMLREALLANTDLKTCYLGAGDCIYL